MATPPTPASPLDTKELLVVLQELGAALRARSEPEHIYTARRSWKFGRSCVGSSRTEAAGLCPQPHLDAACDGCCRWDFGRRLLGGGENRARAQGIRQDQGTVCSRC